MTTTSHTAMTRVKDTEGTRGADRAGVMGTGTTHTGSNSITTTGMTRRAIRTMTICGDLFLFADEQSCLLPPHRITDKDRT